VIAALLLAVTMTGPSQAGQLSVADLLGQLAAGLEAPTDQAEVSLNERIKAAREAAAKKDILAWGKAVMPEKFYKPFCQELHGYFVEIRGAELTSTVAPRGHAKTLVKCKLIPMFQALEELELYDYYLNLQATNKKGVALNFSIKHEFETNPVIRAIYGDVVGSVKWTDEQFMLSNGVVFQGAGAGDSLRGMQFLDRRPKYTIVDDLYDEEDIDKPERIAEKNKWYWSSLYPAREKGKRTSFHTQGTVAGENDLMLELGEKAKTDTGIKHREFSAELPDGEPLWKELNTREDLAKERSRMGDAAYDRENLGDRTSRTNAIIKTHFLTGWRRSPSDFRCDTTADPYSLITVIVGVDPSVGKKQNNMTVKNTTKTGDPAGYARVWKLQPKTPGALPIFFIDNVVAKVLGMQERIDMAKEFVSTARADRRVRLVKVETIAGFDDIGTLIAGAIGVSCEKVPSVPDKLLNLEKKQPFFQNGRVFINDQLPLETIKMVENQLTNNKPVHDDARDAIFLCLDDGATSMKSWVKG
jgi:hypothetical protein